ncbi:MAG: hypothetical protein R3C13_00565 [Hyphomonas sp.]|uniref:hypothetical protein n=1 Tax=Hyphomonas sp. TaxID=87 RepID=UPI0035284DAC
MKFKMIAGAALLAASLTGCIAVSDVSDSDAVRDNTDLAVRVCGGEANVKEVSDEGYKCKTDVE